MITNLEIKHGGSFSYTKRDGTAASAEFPRFLIHVAWRRGCNFEDLADGFGQGLGTCGGDWSGIRDSSDEAIERMLERAITFLELA